MNHTFYSQYPGTCPDCLERINENTRVKYNAAYRVVHEDCEKAAPAPVFEHPVCHVCWLTHPKGDCDR